MSSNIKTHNKSILTLQLSDPSHERLPTPKPYKGYRSEFQNAILTYNIVEKPSIELPISSDSERPASARTSYKGYKKTLVDDIIMIDIVDNPLDAKPFDRFFTKAYKPYKVQRVEHKPVTTIISTQDIARGALPNEYPYYIRELDKVMAPAIVIKNEEDVKELLTYLKNNDPRSKTGENDDSKIPRTYTKRNLEYWTLKEQQAINALKENKHNIFNDYRLSQLGKPITTVPINPPTMGGAVAKSWMDNCLLNILRNSGININKVYKKYPHLKPTPGENKDIYLDLVHIEDIAKMLYTSISLYTRLGYVLKKPFAEYKYNKGKHIKVIVEGEHATLGFKHYNVSRVIYDYRMPNPRDIEGLIVNQDYYIPRHPDELELKYYIVLCKGEFYMIKSYKPSSLTGDPNDDSNPAYYYIFSHEQFLFKQFKAAYKLGSIRDDHIREIVKMSEHFIGRSLFKPVTRDTIALDHNKSFVSYKTCKYYIGFPGNDLAASETPQLPHSPYADAFVVCKNITNYPWYFNQMFQYTEGHIVLPIPLYKYLKDIKCNIEVDYYLASQMKDIDIIDFVEKSPLKSTNDKKLLRNSLIGRCISGGLDEMKQLTINCANQYELDRLVHECVENNLPFSTNDVNLANSERKIVNVKYESKTGGIFQFHSYILTYSVIQVLSKMRELESNKCEIVGFNVDCIFYNGDYDGSINVNDIGGWKKEDIEGKRMLARLKRKPMRENYRPVEIVRPKYFDGFRYLKNTVIIGPPGIGKSHDIKTRPLFDQIITTPTKRLREDHKELFENTFTTHKYLQFSLPKEQVEYMRKKGVLPRLHKTHVIDEFTMFNRAQWLEILDRSGEDTRIIAIGDSEQLCNTLGIDGKSAAPVTIDFFKERGFDIVYLQREPDMICRHSYEEGEILDSLRSLKQTDQVKNLSEHVNHCHNIMNVIDNLITETTYCHYISDKHTKLHKVNVAVRDLCIEKGYTFPVNDKKGGIIRIDPKSPDIWWDRLSFLDVKPQGVKYEPAIAITCDSVQGQTIDTTIYVDAKMRREHCFYTAVTRTTKLENIIIANSTTHALRQNIRPIDDTQHTTRTTIEELLNHIKIAATSRIDRLGLTAEYDSIPEYIPPVKEEIIDLLPVREDVLCDHPKKRRYPQTKKQYISSLNNMIKYITKIFPKFNDDHLESFHSDRLYRSMMPIYHNILMQFDESMERRKKMIASVKLQTTRKYKALQIANKKETMSNPINLVVYNTLYKLTKKYERKGNVCLMILYQNEYIYKLLLALHKKIEHAKDLPQCAEDIIKIWEHIAAQFTDADTTKTDQPQQVIDEVFDWSTTFWED